MDSLIFVISQFVLFPFFTEGFRRGKISRECNKDGRNSPFWNFVTKSRNRCWCSWQRSFYRNHYQRIARFVRIVFNSVHKITLLPWIHKKFSNGLFRSLKIFPQKSCRYFMLGHTETRFTLANPALNNSKRKTRLKAVEWQNLPGWAGGFSRPMERIREKEGRVMKGSK